MIWSWENPVGAKQVGEFRKVMKLKFFLLSKVLVEGTPNVVIHLSIKVLEMVSAAKLQIGKASCHRKKWSHRLGDK